MVAVPMGVWVGSARRWLASGMGVCLGAGSAHLPYDSPRVTESRAASFFIYSAAPIGAHLAHDRTSCACATW